MYARTCTHTHSCAHTHTLLTGVTMFAHLPRHTFGFIQSKLFPKYFLLGTILTAVTILTFLFEHPFVSWNSQEMLQVSLYLDYALCAIHGKGMGDM